MHPLPSRLALAFSLTACLATWSLAAQPDGDRGATKPSPTRQASEDGEPVYRQVARELARLDERLSLGTFPDGSRLWAPRLAASIERRLATPATGAVPGRGLLRRLDFDLRALGADGPLAGPPELQPPPRSAAPGRSWSERLARVLASARLVNRKLDATEARAAERPPTAAGNGLAARSAPANDDCGAATSIGLGTFTGSTLGATNDGTATCGSSGSSSDVWFHYAATEDGIVTFDTFDSTFDTVLSLHTACPATGTELGCSDDADGTLQSSLDLEMTAGEEVWVRLAGFGGDAGDFTLHVAETGGFSGTVTRKDTGAPISGASVRVSTTYGYYLGSVETGADGTYLVRGLTPGTDVSSARADGFIEQLYDGVECFPTSQCSLNDATPITVGSAVTEGIDFSLSAAGSISGTLTEQGTGVALQGYVYVYGSTGGAYLESAPTDADGNYTLDGLPAGSYYLEATAAYHRSEVYDDLPCDSCDVTMGTSIPVTAGASVTGIDFVLDRLGTIEGTVVDQSNSAPLGYYEIDLLTPEGLPRGYAYTTGDGSYAFQGVQPGTYVVKTAVSFIFRDEVYDDVPCENGCSLVGATPVSVSLGGTTSGIDFSLLRLGRLTGTVTDAASGLPLGDSAVSLYDSRGYYRTTSYSQADGTFTSAYLPSDDYFAQANGSDHLSELYDGISCPGACPTTSGTPIPVTAGSTTSGVDFHLVAGGRVSGTVTNATSGSPISGLEVRVYSDSGSWEGSDYTASDGSYQSPGLPAGSYYVVTNASFGYQNEVYDDQACLGSCDPTVGTPVAVALGTTTPGIDFSLVPWGGIQGLVTAADTSDPLASGVYLYDASGQQVDYNYSSSGSFEFSSLAPGSYYLKAVNFEYPDEYEDEVYPNLLCEPSCNLFQGTPVEVPLGVTLAGVSFALDRCSIDSAVDLVGASIFGVYSAEACQRVSASVTTVHSGADATFRAGREIVLGNGFRVESGGTFQAVIDPGVGKP